MPDAYTHDAEMRQLVNNVFTKLRNENRCPSHFDDFTDDFVFAGLDNFDGIVGASTAGEAVMMFDVLMFLHDELKPSQFIEVIEHLRGVASFVPFIPSPDDLATFRKTAHDNFVADGGDPAESFIPGTLECIGYCYDELNPARAYIARKRHRAAIGNDPDDYR